MLELRNIIKNYTAGDTTVSALKGVSISFGKSEFVSVLGPSGCGKTTLLNIIGGLDRYTSGDLIINGVSTKEYTDRDWDTYRNHSVGFVFQSYNLIPHQSVLSNVELALTLSGVSKSERKKRAVKALERVGLGDQIKKKPNQMSGGQMQRVAIARALVNDPDILLADEPTGALDSATSVQVMEILKEVSNDRLVIMVTHNARLAAQYSTRTVTLLDGCVTGDSVISDDITGDNVTCCSAPPVKRAKREKTQKSTSMSFFTALSLSFNNLMTKRARTILTSFAGSIGIIGIALILAMSTGIQSFIGSIQRETLSSYPITIYAEEGGISALLSAFQGSAPSEGGQKDEAVRKEDTVYSNPQMYRLFNSFFASTGTTNDLVKFKAFLDSELESDESSRTTHLYEYAASVQYGYGIQPNCYVLGTDSTYSSCDIASAFESFTASGGTGNDTMYNMISTNMTSVRLWSELTPGTGGNVLSGLVNEQYELLYGEWPDSANEIALILNTRNEISDLAFYALGLVGKDEVFSIINAAVNNTEIDITQRSISYEDICKITLKMVPEYEFYSDTDGDGIWEYTGDDSELSAILIKNGYDLNITCIIRPTDSSSSSMAAFGYTSLLTEKIIADTTSSPVILAQQSAENENFDILTGLPFTSSEEKLTDAEKAQAIKEYFNSLTAKEKTELYTAILGTPPDGYVDNAVNSCMEQYDTREKMEQLIADTYGLDHETMQNYLSPYSDDELETMIRETISKAVVAQYRESAEQKAKELMLTPSREELDALVAHITAPITSRAQKEAYIVSAWTTSTAISARAISSYLASLDDNEIHSAFLQCAESAAEALYADSAVPGTPSGYEKVAAVFDAQYTSQEDTAVLSGYYDSYMPSGTSDSTLALNLETLGYVDIDSPSTVSIYTSSFEDKDAISAIIDDYNKGAAEESQISYTDYFALLLSGVTDIIDGISIGLILFVSVSLVVSSIMIGIITYISVLERTKEIGILRAIGASKRNISQVFNAETLIIGLAAGLIGIGISLACCPLITHLIKSLSGVTEISAYLEPLHCVILIAISMVLTLLSGLIPARIAAKKDPAEALRSE